MTKRIITIYLMVSIITTLLFALHSAVYVTYLLAGGLNLLQVNLVNLCFMIAVFLLEVPTGAVADIYGRKLSFILSCLTNGIGFLIYSTATTFLSFVSAELVIALGVSLASGALKAWLVDSLHFVNWNGKLLKIFRLEGRAITLTNLVGGLAGAFLGVKNLSIPFAVAGSGFCLLALLSCALMREQYFQRKNNVRNFTYNIKQVIRDGVVYGLQNQIIFLVMIVAVVFMLGFQALNMYWQPQYRPFLPDNRYFGFIWAGITLFTILGNELAGKLGTNSLNVRTVYLSLGWIVGLLIFLAGAASPFLVSLSCFYLHELVRGIYRPYTNAVLQENIPSDKRATVDSFVSMMQHGAAGLGLLLTGWVANSLGIRSAWMLSGAMIIAFTPLAVFLSRLKRRNQKDLSD